jgi:hypothetical protein
MHSEAGRVHSFDAMDGWIFPEWKDPSASSISMLVLTQRVKGLVWMERVSCSSLSAALDSFLLVGRD